MFCNTKTLIFSNLSKTFAAFLFFFNGIENLRKLSELILANMKYSSILLVAFLLMACTSRNTTENTEDVNTEVETSEDSVIISDDIWIGCYTFLESWKPNNIMDYQLIIYKEKGIYYAKVIIDGVQTMTRLRAKLTIEGMSASLVFDKYLPENQYKSYKTGDVLLTLERQDEVILTTWEKLKPAVKKNQANGKIYFEFKPVCVYDAGWCELVDVEIPHINTDIIKGEYAKQCNLKIRELYDKIKKDHDNFYKTYDGSGHGPEASYQLALVGDILSLVITYNWSGWAVTTDEYAFFNLNIQTGQSVSADELIRAANITPKNIKTAIELANKNDENGVLQYKDEYYYRKLNMYLDKEGLVVYVLYILNEACEINEYFTPFRPSEWIFTRKTDLTIDEAIDILAKRLNDSKLKYMLGDESESEIVRGEKTHYIRAFHDMGTHIATFGHFYVGCRSGKIYILDVINGEDIIPYNDYVKKYGF